MSVPFQTNYPHNMPIGLAGRIADCGFKNTLSPVALEVIMPAMGVMKPLNVDYAIMLPRNDTASSVFSADLIADNVVKFTVNGVAIPQVTYATSHVATMQAVADAILLIPTVESAVVGGANNRTLTIISKVGTATAVTVATVTGGASQATITTTAGQSGTFFGVTQEIFNKASTFVQSNQAFASSATPYMEGDVVPTLTQGRIYVVPEDLVTSNSAVYLRTVGTVANPQLGSFRSDADAGNAVLIPTTQAIWREGNASVGDLAVLEINLP